MKAITRSFLTLRYVLATIQSPSKCTKELQNLTPHWSSSITKRYKRNAIHGDLCRAECISSDLNNNKMLIRQKFDNANSQWRSYKQISLPPFADRPTQPSILPRSVNEYRIILGLSLGPLIAHRMSS